MSVEQIRYQVRLNCSDQQLGRPNDQAVNSTLLLRRQCTGPKTSAAANRELAEMTV